MTGREDVSSSNSWTISSDLEAVHAVAQEIRRISEESIGSDGANDVEVAVVEALTNLVKHGYPEAPGDIEIAASGDKGLVIVDIFDTGKTIPEEILARAGSGRFEFDPKDVDGLFEGGMGLSIIFMTMDTVDYGSQDGRNRMHLVRHKRP